MWRVLIMKKHKKIWGLGTLIFVCVLVSCILAFAISYAEEKAKVVVIFDNSSDDELPFCMDINEFSDYESKYSKYRESIYYNSLSENDKHLYRVYEYALENSYDEIYLDERFVNDLSYLDILNYLALDSPLLEVNLSTNTHGETENFTKNVCKFWEIVYTTNKIIVLNFNEKNLNQKVLALEKAEEIVSQCPSDLNQLEVAQYYYTYLSERVVSREGTESGCYLYDSLMLNVANCDAFSNAYSLLCNLSGVYCFEKYFPDKDGMAGHVWNCVKINDRYYNVDSGKQTLFSKKLMWFGFSEFAQSDVHSYDTVIPKCDDDMNLMVYLEFNNVNDTDFILKVRNEFIKVKADKDKVLVISVKDDNGVEAALIAAVATEGQSNLMKSENYGTTHYYIFP